ncbi:FIST N-terminal domain-containing protein [Sphingomonas naphthae]|uniref:FIST N-terminal domain-containing protein n=1 Tax=Sphingomonas naphthae TaxID=1813468 RepID=A0ABY7TJJ4_9SPHN|nr:FIST N-terminal domain-containing protein [Sphingomonas naphthae]WCT73198.1 FIST N-terminal domain-containing protein [Sphingomonas naphthae]
MATFAPDAAPASRTKSPIRVASSALTDPEQAIREIFGALDAPTLAGILLFCSSRYDLNALAKAIALRCEDITIVGCTSSSEIGPEGLSDGEIVAIGFPAEDFTLSATRFDRLDDFDTAHAQQRVRELVAEAAEGARRLDGPISRAAIFLVDGLSHREEMLTVTVQDALGEIPLIGGSSGDGLAFKETFVLEGGRFHRDAAVVAILSSRRPLRVFRHQPYQPGAVKMVITGADSVERIVTEINAEPAAAEYARLAGVQESDLGPGVFARHPPMVRAGGEYYVRSIQSANPDGSLTFYCAIDEGIVLTLGESNDMMRGLDTLFDTLDGDVGGIDRVLGFFCVLNTIDLEQRQLIQPVSRLLTDRKVVGFTTYGEQFHALHVNQTFSGLAIGR